MSAAAKAQTDELEQAADAIVDKVKPLVGTDPEKGKLFDVPRLAVVADEADPTVLKISFSGGIELERSNRDQVEFYNRLKAGKVATLKCDVFVAGPKNAHRRDSEGNVDSIVQTKSLVITDVTFS